MGTRWCRRERKVVVARCMVRESESSVWLEKDTCIFRNLNEVCCLTLLHQGSQWRVQWRQRNCGGWVDCWRRFLTAKDGQAYAALGIWQGEGVKGSAACSDDMWACSFAMCGQLKGWHKGCEPKAVNGRRRGGTESVSM